jgi:hypothetical protein
VKIFNFHPFFCLASFREIPLKKEAMSVARTVHDHLKLPPVTPTDQLFLALLMFGCNNDTRHCWLLQM